MKHCVYMAGMATILGCIVVAVAVQAETCTGKVKVQQKCSDERLCDIATNPNCLVALIMLPTNETCTSTGALPADNCKTTVTDEICGIRYDCSTNMAGTMCVQGGVLGYVYHKMVIDGGSCSVPG